MKPSMLKRTRILHTKLNKPPVTAEHVPRPRLIGAFEQNIYKPLTLISAPAGYGKSMLMSSVLDIIGVPYAWISLDEMDNDLRLFLCYLIAAIKQHFPQSLPRTSYLIEAVELPAVTIIAQTFINELDVIDSKFMIVLDDYHKIENTQIHELIGYILKYPPQQLHLALLTRKDPPLKLHNLRAHNKLTELRIRGLTFTLPEIITLFQKTHGFTMTDQDSKSILDRTEGWITGLRMASLSITNYEDLENLLKSMKGNSTPAVSQFLIEEVLLKQPEEIQEYLLRISILDRFCAELLDELFFSDQPLNRVINDGKTLMDWLQKTGMFVIPLDMENRWFRYHHLFQKLLKMRLKQIKTSKDYENDYAKTSIWFEQEGLIEESIGYALKAGDFGLAATTIERHRQNELDMDRWYTVQRWLDMLPAIEQKNPDLFFAEAWIYYERFQLEQIPPLLDKITRLLKNETKKPELWGELYFFRGNIDFWAGNGESAKQHFTKAKTHMPRQKNLTWGLLELLQGLARYMTGDKDKAIQDLNKRIRESRSNEELYLSRLIAGLFFIYQLAGQLYRAREEAIKMHIVAKQSGIIYTDAWGSYMQACTFLQANDLEKAVYHFTAVAGQRYIFHIRAAVDTLAALSLTRQLMQEPDEASESLDQLFSFVREKRDPGYLAIADSCRARISLLRGDLPAAMQWVDSVSSMAAPMELFIWLEVPQITRARVLIADSSKKNLKKAWESLTQLRQTSERCHYTCQIIEISVLQSLALERMGKTEQALDILEEVVALAGPLGWIRPFIEAGPPMADLLVQLQARGVTDDYLEMLLIEQKRTKYEKISTTLEHHSKDTATLSPVIKIPEPELLSRRELEIVRLLAQGLRNKEIATRLYLSLSTIKSHLYNIYQKWNVHSRTSLLAKARKFGMINE